MSIKLWLINIVIMSVILSNVNAGSICLTGNTVSTNDAVSLSNLVFNGAIINLGKTQFGGKGTLIYGMAIAKASAIYLGATEGTIKLNLRVKHLTGKFLETAPTPNESYIFFVSQKNAHNYVLKLLPATDDNITKVKALIAALPPSK